MQMRMPRLFVIFAGLVIAIAFAVAGPADAAGRVSSGTGFFVSKRGYLITNFHVVESCLQVGVQVGRAIDTARVVALDPANDLALLATHLKPLQVADLRVAAPEGETTISYGFPLGTDRTTIGTVLGLTGWHDGKLLYLQSGNEPGMSGSAVIDRTGNVIGVNVGVLGLRIAKATGSAAVAALLDTHGVGHAESDPAQQRPLVEVIERAKKITAKVLCRSDWPDRRPDLPQGRRRDALRRHHHQRLQSRDRCRNDRGRNAEVDVCAARHFLYQKPSIRPGIPGLRCRRADRFRRQR